MANCLLPGNKLLPGDQITSANGKYFLVYQATDGNLVLYGNGGQTALWASGAGHGIGFCIMQPDGNLVVYVNNNPVWASGTNNNPGSYLVMQDDGNAVIFCPTWTTNPSHNVFGLRTAPTQGNTLYPGQFLFPNQKITSTNGKYFLIYQGTDGNLVVYGNGGGAALWASGAGHGVGYCLMQDDGNLVVYVNPNAVWSSGTNGNRGSILVMQDDGWAVIFRPIWATKPY